ncbi:MAG: arginine--tRNA ligase [Myxococcaceae bacterium]|nr:arginine--tRNA ligase [Myxococcaceae bacterium]
MTTVLEAYQREFAEALAKALNVTLADVERQLKPADPQHADFTFPTFALAKTLKEAPLAIAARVASQLEAPSFDIAAAGGYVNARIKAMPFTGHVLDAARAQGLGYGGSDSGRGKTVVIDYSSPNIAKPIAYHHIRSTAIGHALANLYRASGYQVEGINYLGDWGKQFGLVAVGFQEWGDPARKHEVSHLVEVYQKANKRADGDKKANLAPDVAFDESARAFFRRMELGDPQALAFWEEVRRVSIDDFKKVYQRLGIAFEHYEGESRYQGKMESVIAQITAKPGTKESDGALIVDMPYDDNEPPVLLKKTDGSTLYATRDITAAVDRFERFHFARALYVVATDQSLHFRQVFKVLDLMGKEWAKTLTHVNFGRVHGMSTRQGNLKLLREVLDEASARALEKVNENIAEGRMQTDNPKLLAEQIGIGGIVFNDLKNPRTTDYTFRWEDILNFEGHSGPYLQYAHARTLSILTKGGGAPKQCDAALLTLPEEQALVRSVAKLPKVVADAIEHNEPSLLARHLLELAAEFSRYFTAGNQDRTKRILLDEEGPLRAARLGLTDAVRLSLANGLRWLGLATPERM